MDRNVISNPEKSNEYDEEPSLGHLIMNNLTKAGDRILLISGITSDELSAKDLLERSINIAKSLIAAGIQPGDVVSIVSENRFEFAYVLLGTLLINCTFAPVNLTYSEREIKHAMNLSKPKVVFTSRFASDKVVHVAKSLTFVQKLILIDEENPYIAAGVILFKDFLGSKSTYSVVFSLAPINKTIAVALILCSSGTTGQAKGVQISQNNLFVVTRFCKNTVLKLDVENENKVILGLIPWFHAFGLTTLTGIITSTVGKIVLLPKFEEGLFLSCIENYRCNVLFLVPPLMVMIYI